MKRPDFKHDKIAQTGLWIWIVLWTVSMVMDWFDILPRFGNPLTIISFCVVILTLIYAIVKSFRTGCTKFGVLLSVLLVVMAGLAIFVFQYFG